MIQYGWFEGWNSQSIRKEEQKRGSDFLSFSGAANQPWARRSPTVFREAYQEMAKAETPKHCV
jgi:hypothetical protein